MMPVRPEPAAAPRSQVKHSTTELLRSLFKLCLNYIEKKDLQSGVQWVSLSRALDWGSKGC